MTHKEYLKKCKDRRYLLYTLFERYKIEGRKLKELAAEHQISYQRLYQIHAKTRKEIEE